MSGCKEAIPDSGAIRLSEAAWAEARRRAAVIRPLAEAHTLPARVAAEAGRTLNLSERTIYILVKRWRATDGSIPSLITAPSNKKRPDRLPEEVERLVSAAITKMYLSKQRIRLSTLMMLIRTECQKAGLRSPSRNTVRTRIDRRRPDELVRRRHGRDAARRLQAVEGRFPVAEQPLDAVQIDHTRVDITVVDPFTRQPIGRPWISIAIDVHTRCIVGFCLTLEAPSAVSVGLCLTHAAMDKKPWLERIGVESEWPMAGKPKVIHVDNGADFHSEALRRGCDAHGIRIVYRPVGAPHYGGIVERVHGMAEYTHALAFLLPLDHRPDRHRYVLPWYSFRRFHSPRGCRDCLTQAAEPYLRLHWRFSWVLRATGQNTGRLP